MAPTTAHRPGAIRAAWYRWKSVKFWWRRRWLVGYDLNGRTFWEFQNQLNPGRPRRIVQYPRGTHYGDVAFTPAWLQWLRQTRPDAPSIEEQQFELQRQSQMKQLAIAADERWKSKQSFLDGPAEAGQVGPALRSRDAPDDATQNESAESQHRQRRSATQKTTSDRGGEAENPWKQFEERQGTPGEGWQPDAWAPGNTKPAPRH